MSDNTAPLRPRDRIRNETIDQIKSLARQQMAEDGAINISLRAIARQMGLTSPAIFHYFPSYDTLITALIVDAYDASADAMEAAIANIPETEYRVRLYALDHAYRNWALANPQDYLLINGTPIPGYHAPEEETKAASNRTFYLFMQVLASAYHAGKLSLPEDYPNPLPAHRALQRNWAQDLDIEVSVPVIHVALVGWGLLRGLIEMELYGGAPEVMEETFELEVNAYLQRIGLEAE
jgi:AcrR family transcriptional regulator